MPRWLVIKRRKANSVEVLVFKAYTSLSEISFHFGRFAESYVSGKLRIKHWGVNKIKQGLLLKRLDRDLIAQAIVDLYEQEDYFGILKEVAERKWRELYKEKDPWMRKQKLFRFLASRGFNYDEFSDLKFE